MALREKYAAFLATPSSAALADAATLHYIATLTSIHDAAPILKHFAVQEKLLKKKEQKIVHAIEGANALSVDVETTLEFVNGGGAYLPGLDDNFVADRVVTFPMVHNVHFDAAGKIVQIRQYWDQGSLLKQIDVIGARSRNWPIRDGKDQAKLIATSAAAVAKTESAPSSRPSTASRGADEVSISSRSRGSTSAVNDPHASLSLFQPRTVEEESSQPAHPGISRVQSAKPPPREYSELFVGENIGSPSPSQKIPVKSGGGKSFKTNRLFDEAEDDQPAPTPLSVKTNAKKFNHFEFGDGEDSAQAVRNTARPIKTKHQSNWDFEDFSTPHKPKQKTQPQAVRHFGWSDDEVGLFFQAQRIEDEGSPVRRPIIHKARPDADAQFEFADESTPEAQRRPPPTKGRMQNKGMGLYTDHVTNTTTDSPDSAPARGDVKKPLNDVTTAIKNENRNKDFGAHWEVGDQSPALSKNGNGTSAAHHSAKQAQDAHKATKNNFGIYQSSPGDRGINIAGNGMGGRKGTEAHWSLFEESPVKGSAKENEKAGLGSGPVPAGAGGVIGGIKTTGDGMGGRKGAESFWDF